MDILKQNNQPTKEHKNSPQKQMFLKDLSSTMRKKKKKNSAFIAFLKSINYLLLLEYTLFTLVYRKIISNVIIFFLL